MAPKQRCLYEVLEVAREAEDGEIKKAYRKMALMWHPGAGVTLSRCDLSSGQSHKAPLPARVSRPVHLNCPRTLLYAFSAARLLLHLLRYR